MAGMRILDRVKEYRKVRACDLVPHPANWRTHPEIQASALRDLLKEIGFAGAVIARELKDKRLQIMLTRLSRKTLERVSRSQDPVLFPELSGKIKPHAEAYQLALFQSGREHSTTSPAASPLIAGAPSAISVGSGAVLSEAVGPQSKGVDNVLVRHFIERRQQQLEEEKEKPLRAVRDDVNPVSNFRRIE